jgi:uncharacterized protein YlxW (UPF0749 family)
VESIKVQWKSLDSPQEKENKQKVQREATKNRTHKVHRVVLQMQQKMEETMLRKYYGDES